ncbi:hypothetical protein F4561_003885 [Lipingzhangella halophila]|uniref:Uncharacterized protein n=1 Tax=Lipingzhangella halophila TaxID=1783352 RepID=A0A7W7RJH6_9ACTN|nr:hypothetical protein [Lipingzhangella halophila]MBB4933065.1 hypothetical protein [Lipingzhangella halophila]
MPDGYDASEDERVLASLRGDGGPGPMPDTMRASVRAAFAARRSDSVFADVHEDGVDSPRGDLRDGESPLGAPRYVWLRAPGVEVRLEITAIDGQRDIVGQIDPAEAATVEVRCPYRVTRHDIDANGAFVARGVPKGPVSLLFQRTSEPSVTTRWIAI